MNRESVVTTVAGFAVVVAVFGVLFWVVDVGDVVAAARRADPVLLSVVAGTILLWNASWGVALWNVLRATGVDIPVKDAVLVNAAGAFANHVTPFGQAGGEPVTAWLLARTTDSDYEVGLASITSFDAMNVVPSVAFMVAGSVYVLLVGTGLAELGALPFVVLAAAVVVPAVAVVAWRNRRALRRRFGGGANAVGRRVADVVPRVTPAHVDQLGERVAGFAAAVERLAVDRRRLAAVLAFSTLGWAFQAVGLWVTFLALASSIPPYVPFFVLPFGKLGSVVPTPGGLGGSEAINVALLAVFTDAGAGTIAAAVTIHSVGGYLLTTSVGAAATSVLGVRE